MEIDVFISYSSKDKSIADKVLEGLEKQSVKCWIAPRDILPGKGWTESIPDAIASCKVMVIIFSSHTNESKNIANEVTLASNDNKTIVPFRIEDIKPAKTLAYHLSIQQWFDAFDIPIEEATEKLSNVILTLIKEMQGESPLPNKVVEKDQNLKQQTHEHSDLDNDDDVTDKINVKKIDRACRRLSEHLVEILTDAWYEKWEPYDENVIRSMEESKEIKEVWTYTPNFDGLLQCKKGIVVHNVCCNEIKYKIIFPERCHEQFEELLDTCAVHSESEKSFMENIEGKCLLGRQITPMELVICIKEGKHKIPYAIYFFYSKVPKNKRVLKVPPPSERNSYWNNLVDAFALLWEALPTETHHH